MPFLIKAVATALRHHPAINAVIDMENDQIIYKDYVNIGIAVDTERGLVVPNIRHVDALTIPDIARGLADLAARVRGGEWRPPGRVLLGRRSQHPRQPCAVRSASRVLTEARPC